MKTTISAKLLSFAAFALLSSGSLQAQTLLEQAQSAFKVKNYRQAIIFYEQGLSKEPPTIEAQNELAQAYLITNEPAKAAAWFEKTMRNPEALANIPLLPFYYGQSLQMIGEYEKAKTAFSKMPSQYKERTDKLLSFCDFATQNKDKNSIFQLKNESSLNSEKADYAPAFYKNKLVYASSRTMPLFGGYSDATFNWLYMSDRNGASVGEGKIIASSDELSMTNNGNPVSYSKDGDKVAYMLNSFTDGRRHLYGHNISSGELHITTANSANNWQQGENTAFPHFKLNGVIVGFPALSPDGKTLYFSANPNSGLGGFDIFVSFLENGRWSEPQNLGGNINTPGDEISPFIAEDGKLYFSSNFHKGFGGYDIYTASLEAGVWKNVRNLGKGVNSNQDDLYFIFDDANNIGYFSSNRDGGLGDYDIYSAKLVGSETNLPFVVDKEAAEVLVKYPNGANNGNIVNNNPNPKKDKINPDNGGKFNPQPNKTNPTNNGGNANNNSNPAEAPCATNFYIGAIQDASSKTAVTDAAVYVKNLSTASKEKVMTNKFGEYSLILEPMTEYLLVVSKMGYENETFQVQTKSGGQKTLLGTRYLRRAGTTVANTDVFGDPVDDNGFTPNNPNNNPTTNVLDNINGGSKKYSLVNPNNELPDTGYVIQIGIFSRLSESVLSKVAQYGNVSTEPRNNLTAYKVGIFADKKHADAALEELKKEGFADAWKKSVKIDNQTLAGKLANASQLVYPPTADKPQPSNNLPPIKENNYSNWADNGEKKSSWSNPAPASNGGKSVEYKVQLGAFKEPEKVSFSNLSDLAPLEKQLGSNGLTYFYLAGFETLNAAQQAKERAAARGVQTPFVVGFKNGNRVALSELNK